MSRGSAGVHARNYILAGLPDADRALLDRHVGDVPLVQGQLLHAAGLPVQHIYFPHSGVISLLSPLRDGQAIKVATVGREGVAGTIHLLGSNLSPVRSKVQVAGSAARIAVGAFTDAFIASAAIRGSVIDYNEVLLCQIQTTAACNALHPVEERLARWVLQTADRIDNKPVPLTQEILSQMLGVQRTSVTLVARALQAAGLIRYSRGQIHILRRDELEGAACECYGAIRARIESAQAAVKALNRGEPRRDPEATFQAACCPSKLVP